MTGPKTGNGETTLVPLHRNTQYTDACMRILNEQWPRSNALRMRSLTSSSDNYPTNLVLLRKTSDDATEVIGHSRINTLPQGQRDVWIESVIIRQDLRGKGFGRTLMTATEDYARACGFETAYLSTHDQQVFYGKLGYEFCPPVCIYGGCINRNLLPKQFLTAVTPQNIKKDYSTSPNKGIDRVSELCNGISAQCSLDNRLTNNSTQSVGTAGVLPHLHPNSAPSPPPPPAHPCLKKDQFPKMTSKE
ncbi:putative N-acetyltransferase 6-like isoform X2 [Penaeus vannamei]|uniref:Putative N-acetyltransferase 6-like isoform X2 n=1 Tax=Penaeus vannamei TaxID=6689 RepID=A0A423UB08_PENVA|nr:N-alpha-acetyltransferase 80-like isoform X1 [Penaeus vannamei]XP_027211564.1 N-alpha-acetyltransferase 80-like isoform X1 [Penaeus vannamei]ROT85898.1 putative N-acetyltransferase 6-like isoform X2 [Penaeus vannamei]